MILDKLECVKKTSSGWTARCPAHDDGRSSLSISTGDDGKTLIHCHAGCTPEAVVGKLGLRMSDLMPSSNGKHASNGKPEIVETYSYTDESGDLLYQVCRMIPKDFRQRKPKVGGGWEWTIENVRRVLYRLPQLLAAAITAIVFIVEGEKDVDQLVKLGLVATTNAGGAGKWRPEYNEHLRGRPVVILPDHDQVGQDHARKWRQHCTA